MNSSINYSGFVEMFINSDDEFEPYGCTDSSAVAPPHHTDGTEHERQQLDGEQMSSSED